MQRRLALVGSPAEPLQDTAASITRLIRDLVRIRTQGGIDDQAPALAAVSDWLEQHGVAAETLVLERRKNPKNRAVGLLGRIGDAHRGPTYCLTACLDTATIGRPDTWEHPATGATMLPNGWLIGRGSGDSKAGAAIFCAIMAALQPRQHELKGQLLLLIDSDEHTGRFGAIKELLEREKRINGVYIGYPGQDSIKVGARGFYRAKVVFYGASAHSGASAELGQNAVVKAARFVCAMQSRALPAEADAEFGRGPKMTVSQITGGRGYSSVPDSCFVRIDFRLTPSFAQRKASRLLRDVVGEIDAAMPTLRASRIDSEQSWPAYRLAAESPIVRALAESAARELGRPLVQDVSGPSNVGNFLRSYGIDATCGFGVIARNIHAADEMIDTGSILPTYLIYRRAIEQLLTF